MSFKREGDDWSQLNVLKKRRVGDLLASYIPEDEALMLRDGRPDAPRPCASHSPSPAPEVEGQSGKISREPEPEAGPQSRESATLSAPAPVSPTRRR
uniref:Uncharacterized protein n=1 Tax=Jaculus jaculus TaxID=51337 RepID=A0A8C5P5I4_JACJA